MSAWDRPRGRREPSPAPTTQGSLLAWMPAAANQDEKPAYRYQSYFDVSTLASFVVSRLRIILLLSLVLMVVLTALFLTISFPFKASAIVFVDPRDQKVTLQEEVMPAIGSDAAVLESMVQIVRSDGFLIDLMRKLNMLDGADWTGTPKQLELLGKLRKQIVIERMGATYLVNVSYLGSTGEEAARIANEVANAFAAQQNGQRSSATEAASKALADRLVDIRQKLNSSEEAVARFKADNNIVYVDQQNTVQMRQLTDLTQQLAAIRNATGEAQARYNESASTGTLTRSTNQGTEESEQLAFLRRQLAQLEQIKAQQMQNLGARHPRLQETQRMIQGVTAEISRQSQRMVGQLRSERDINVSKQEELQKQIDDLSARIAKTEQTKVKLASLEREAAADREIYEQLLSRNKATYELSFIPTDNVRVVSPAVVPVKSTRPPLSLLLPVLAILSLIIALALVILGNIDSLRRRA